MCIAMALGTKEPMIVNTAYSEISKQFPSLTPHSNLMPISQTLRGNIWQEGQKAIKYSAGAAAIGVSDSLDVQGKLMPTNHIFADFARDVFGNLTPSQIHDMQYQGLLLFEGLLWTYYSLRDRRWSSKRNLLNGLMWPLQEAGMDQTSATTSIFRDSGHLTAAIPHKDNGWRVDLLEHTHFKDLATTINHKSYILPDHVFGYDIGIGLGLVYVGINAYIAFKPKVKNWLEKRRKKKGYTNKISSHRRDNITFYVVVPVSKVVLQPAGG